MVRYGAQVSAMSCTVIGDLLVAVAASTNSPAPQRRRTPAGSRCAGFIHIDETVLVGLDSGRGQVQDDGAGPRPVATCTRPAVMHIPVSVTS